ncbi:MAG: hypothetical protein LBT05_15420 [Planctomycetaceae bacterium]|jgi:flagellin-like hook-associated protein FlgL|nr:hypothetical protein [Planctomycetaceae bacterium]
MSGLYVNTNVNSMTAATNLTNNMGGLSDVLTRLSTGLRINSAKDDPAGLIAGETLRSQITASNAALKNTQRANGMIAMADSALGQVGDLLNDIRGLVNEAANTGAMSSDQVAANQLQVDASLDAIDRIARTTQYMGKNLLDGSMSFQTTGVDRSKLQNLNITSANFGTYDKVGVNIDIIEAAKTAAQVLNQSHLGSDGAMVQITGNQGSQTFSFGAGTSTRVMAENINAYTDSTGVKAYAGGEATAGIIDITSAGKDNDIILQANVAGEAAGNYSVKFTAGDAQGISYQIINGENGAASTVNFQLKMDEWKNASGIADESKLGIYTTSIGTNGTGFLFSSTTGSNVKQVDWVVDNGANTPTVVFDKNSGVMTITGKTAETAPSVLTAINTVSSQTGITAANWGSAGIAIPAANRVDYTTDARANNGLTLTAKTGDSSLNDTDIVVIGNADSTASTTFNYVDTAQTASAVIQNGTGKYIQFKATEAGSAYNGYKFVFNDVATATDVSVALNEKEKTITLNGAFATPAATYVQIRDAVNGLKNSEGKQLFQMEVYETDPTNAPDAKRVTNLTGTIATITANTSVTTGAKFGQVGTDHGAMIISIAAANATSLAAVTAQSVIDAFNSVTSPPAGLDELQAMFNLSGVEGAGTNGTIFLATDFPTGTTSKTLSYDAALQGGSNGNVSNTTAKELVDFINSDETLSKLFNASLAANSQSGNGKVTLFDEFAYYGNAFDGTGLQFLGPDGSGSIEFTTNGNAKNQELGVEWTPDKINNSTANLAAYNANAALSLEVIGDDAKYSDMVVRFKQVVEDPGASAVVYKSGPSNAIAYGTISTGANEVNGKFIFEALNGGERYNNVTVDAKIDGTQAEKASFAFDESTGKFSITVNAGTVTLAQVIDAFNQSELKNTFKFELDYSDTDAATVNDGSQTFADLLAGGGTKTIANTGQTGGHTGGVLEIALYGETDNDGVTAADVAALVEDSSLSNTFRMTNYSGSDGTGTIHARYDTVGDQFDPTGKGTASTTNGMRMVTSNAVEKGHLKVNLATDAAGNSITTATDLVNLFETLTPEQTKGISVSLILPDGQQSTVCDTSGGDGVLQSTTSRDNCNYLIDNNIYFESANSVTKDATPLAEIVAVNGHDAGFTLFSKTAGLANEGVTLAYADASTNQGIQEAVYNAADKKITVYVDSSTTASAVKSMIENGSDTKDLFTVELRGSGAGVVNLSDDSVSLTDGTYQTTPKGGAYLQWNKDDESGQLFLESEETGSDQFVSVKTINGTFNVVDADTGQQADRSYGTDTVATVNGQLAQSSGQNISLNTTNLAFSATLDRGVQSGDSLNFDIVSGGAIFQLGQDVVSAQQVRLGIPSVLTTDLGGLSGKLYELRSGGRADLSGEQSAKIADRIVKEAITQVSSTRGRLGAIQKATLESNITTLQNSIEALTSARSDIIDADFATESSNLTKYQILVQSGSQVLGLANQLPQYAASLIG